MGTKFIISVIGMFLVTYIPRFMPVYGLTKIELPQAVKSFLEYVPVAVLSALLFPVIFIKDGKLFLDLSNVYLLSAIPTFIAAYFTRKLFTPVVVGIVSYVILSYIIK
ncbi:MAG: Branched-chain amino acid transport [Caldanaerobacter subterraneus]|nr:MAG: Branched-chain amino acid transport [Caldanaerobacter subterraneus]